MGSWVVISESMIFRKSALRKALAWLVATESAEAVVAVAVMGETLMTESSSHP
jgi:hypothetical protein